MLNSRYWYTDSQGNTQKYLYCKLCHDGPFRKDQEGDRYFICGGTLCYCKNCSSLNNDFKKFVPETFFTGYSKSKPAKPKSKSKYAGW